MKYSPANVIGGAVARGKVWFTVLDAERRTERYD